MEIHEIRRRDEGRTEEWKNVDDEGGPLNCCKEGGLETAESKLEQIDGEEGTDLGPYHTGRPVEEEWYEGRWAFTSHPFAPGRKYRGTIQAPACWSLHQTLITDYFQPLKPLNWGLKDIFGGL